MLIDYRAQRTFEDTLDIEDPGNCCIKCTTDEMDQHYIRLKSVMGTVHVLKMGPVNPDLEALLENFSVYYKSFKYSQKVITKELTLFLNDPNRKIVSATVTTEEEMFNAIPEIAEYFKKV